jgi:hypothetical protein
MYNLSIDVAHTYFVGNGQWLVHNSGKSVPLGPYLLDNDVLIAAQRGDTTALQLMKGNYITSGVLNEFLNVNTNAQRQALKAFISDSGVQVLDGNLQRQLAESPEFRRVFDQLVKAGHSRTDAAVAAFSKAGGISLVTGEKRLYNVLTNTYRQLGVSVARYLNGSVQCP